MKPFFAVMHNVLAADSALPPTARLVALVIADALRVEDGRAVAWPGVKVIALRSGLKERAVRSAIGQLIRAGVFSVERRSSHRGRLPDRFVLGLGNRHEVPSAQPARDAASQALQPAPNDTSNRHVVPSAQPAPNDIGNRHVVPSAQPAPNDIGNRHLMQGVQQTSPNRTSKEIPTESPSRAARGGGRRKPSASSWSSEACADWNGRYGLGSAQGGRIAKALTPLVAAYTWDRVRPAWQRYLREREETYASANDFAAKYLAWEKPGLLSAPKPTQAERSMAVVEGFVLGVA